MRSLTVSWLIDCFIRLQRRAGSVKAWYQCPGSALDMHFVHVQSDQPRLSDKRSSDFPNEGKGRDWRSFHTRADPVVLGGLGGAFAEPVSGVGVVVHLGSEPRRIPTVQNHIGDEES